MLCSGFDLALIIPIMIFAIPLAGILGTILLLALRMILGNKKSGGGELNREEARLMQELHSGLEKMEKRVENLESLLIEKFERQS